ncbi:hypothetical protein QUV83_03255 [Cellulomonas cellasea]|uniref:hypothetical protein n=1 Tax=Cellulomonas cellasea TaxID=43670 RepID=UPI0025A3F4D4|nr:hypothetical protein [Cellulomonas cellasea]MDM8083782.1 hypothetical protein [Cellulomonas cellasea]
MKVARSAVVGICLVILAGCTGYDPLYGDTQDDSYWNEPQEIDEPEPPIEPAPDPAPVWVCVYSPTYDDDWHNDVECSDGINVDRPYLREWDSFVTENEIMDSAQEHEDALNSGAVP